MAIITFSIVSIAEITENFAVVKQFVGTADF